MTIADKAVLVTGANRGIGQALVAEALRRGAKRVYAGTRQPMAHPDGRVTPLTLDVTNPAQTTAAAEQVDALDVLVNNAGLALYDDLRDRAALERHLAVNLFGTYGVTQAFLPLLTRSRAHASGPVRAVPLFVGSYPAVWTLVGVAVYAVYRPHGSFAAGAVAIAAGGYEFTPLKQHFRRRCRACREPTRAKQ
jgi:NAD(P)-dependent dehydrogenase (short-subunit alcohol dehydrogenase family)